MSSKVCFFGELLFRFMPSVDLIEPSAMGFSVGGAELNVARALSLWQIPTTYVTALPDNYISKSVVSKMEREGIDMSFVHFSGERIGIYYLPAGLELKHLGVVYDRAHSAFSNLDIRTINWSKALADTQWLHVSAISPALNKQLAEATLEAVKAAKAMGVKVSIDLNYRSKLWDYGFAPPTVMKHIVANCDAVMGNIWAMESLLDIKSSIQSSLGKTKAELLEAAEQSINSFLHTYRATTIALTFRLEQSYWAVIKQNDALVVSKEYHISNPLDRVGTGDCFMAGLLYGLYKGFSTQNTVDFSVAAAVGKHYELGDATKQTVEDVYKIIKP